MQGVSVNGVAFTGLPYHSLSPWIPLLLQTMQHVSINDFAPTYHAYLFLVAMDTITIMNDADSRYQ